MKKVLFLFVSTLLISASFVSCSSDDDKSGSDSEALIIGKWNLYKETEFTNGQLEYEELYEHLCPSKKDYVEFKASGEFTQSFYDEACEVDTNATTYSISGDYILIDNEDEDEAMSLKIKTLNSSTLIVESEEEWEGVTYKYVTELRK